MNTKVEIKFKIHETAGSLVLIRKLREQIFEHLLFIKNYEEKLLEIESDSARYSYNILITELKLTIEMKEPYIEQLELDIINQTFNI